ncbi:MAG: hypothetical protein ACRET2_00445, partial [Steroidobacteraceae bacterium]
HMLLLGACTALLALPSFAATHSTRPRSANPMRGLTRFSGTIKRVDGSDFKITGQGGTTATYRLAKSARIMASKTVSMADLKSGKFVGCTAVQHHNAKLLQATECHIFPASMRGTGEGHEPMGPPHTTMTNGNIASMTNGNVRMARGNTSGVVLDVTYKGGAQHIEVSPRTHVTLIEAGNASWLKPGVKVMGAARMEKDGTALVEFLELSR